MLVNRGRIVGLVATSVLALSLVGEGCARNQGEADQDGDPDDVDVLTDDDASAGDSSSGVEESQTSESTESEEDDDDDDGASDETSVELPEQKFDLLIPDLPPLDLTGCQKVDFLFVIDNSGSMADEQKNLKDSFPGFMNGIRETLKAQDFHIMAVDTDAESSFQTMSCTNGECQCTLAPGCCIDVCEQGNKSCNGDLCTDIEPQKDCRIALGSGRVDDGAGNDCDIADDRRFMLADQPDLDASFACVASVGIDGDAEERPMDAMLAAISKPFNESDGCNAGFLRDDAILVVTFITDEEEKPGMGGSMGGPSDWYDALVAAKGGNEAAVVVIGFFGDTDQPGAICSPPTDLGDGAEPSPLLREFVTLAGEWGLIASVCADDYGPYFAEAISKIDNACDSFDPK
jgi:hypothetical protein